MCRCPWTAPQRGLVVPLLQRALQALTAGYIGARIGATITDTGHTPIRIAPAMERTSRIATTDPAMEHTSRGLGTATGTSRGGRAETASRSVWISNEPSWAIQISRSEGPRSSVE